MTFKCETDQGADLCFFGGACSAGNASERAGDAARAYSCDCPRGYTRDFTLFHDPNCALPEKALIVFFLESCAWAIALLALVARESLRCRKKFRRMVRFLMFCLLCSAMFSLALWLEVGLFEASLVWLALYIWSFLRTIVEVMQVFFTSASAIVQSRDESRTYRRALVFTAAALELSIIGMFVALVVLCRKQSFNLAFGICMLILGAFNVLLASIAVHEIRRLETFAQKQVARLPSGNDVLTAKWKDLVWRLRALKVAIAIYASIFILGILALPIIHFVLGSVPFAWVFLFAANHIIALSCGSVLFFLRQPSEAAYSFFAMGENLETDEVTAFRSIFGRRTPQPITFGQESHGQVAISSANAQTGVDTQAQTAYDTQAQTVYDTRAESQNSSII